MSFGVQEDAAVLDACCGSRMFWFDKENPSVIFGDIRREEHTLCDGRKLVIDPDVLLDFTALPFEDGRFKLVVFDPPHLDNAGLTGWQGLKYGRLTGDWKEMLRRGFAECFRVLENDGVLVFKWNETRIKTAEVLRLTPCQPLLGHRVGKGHKTHWYLFLKTAAVNEAKTRSLGESKDSDSGRGEGNGK
jgi:SAM-dependent methyltransferase